MATLGQRLMRVTRPPGPSGIPLLGVGIAFGRDPLDFLTECARRYGDLVAFNIGAWPTVLVNNPHDIEQILVKNHRNFTKHRFFWRHVRAIFGAGSLTAEGDDWQRQRRLNAPAFGGQRLAGYGAIMVRRAESMLDTWKPRERFDVHAEMMALTLQIAVETLFGTGIPEDIAEIDRATNVLMAEISTRFRRPFFIPDAIPTPGNLRYRRALDRIDRLVSQIVSDRRHSGEDRGDLLSMLLLARYEDNQPMSHQQIRDEVITMLIAGHETTALALSWTCFLLSRHPDVQAKLDAELREVLKERAPTTEDLPHLVFCERIITEAIRLYPPAWGVGREAVSSCELGGYSIPAGTTLIIAPWVLHRDSRYFESPTDFRPDRWDGSLAKQLPRFAYMPFGGGPRICIGNRFAMMEAVLILATISQRFSFGRLDEEPKPFPSITLRPAQGVWLRPQPRASQRRA